VVAKLQKNDEFWRVNDAFAETEGIALESALEAQKNRSCSCNNMYLGFSEKNF